MAKSAWYPMTYRASALPAAVSEAQRGRYERLSARDHLVRAELLTELQQCLEMAPQQAAAALARWQAWANTRREAVARTLGTVAPVAVTSAERTSPVRSEAAGVVTMYRVGFDSEDAPPGGHRSVAEVTAGARAQPGVAVVVLPHLEPALGSGRRADGVPWLGMVTPESALILPELPSVDRAYNAACKAMLVSGTTFAGRLLAEVAALGVWLRRERGYRRVVLAGEGDDALLALLGTALLPDIDGCALWRPRQERLWPLDTMLLLPEARRTMDAAVLAALVPPRGLLLLGQADVRCDCEEWLYAAQAGAALCDPTAAGVPGRSVAACAREQSEAVAAWLRAVRDGAVTGREVATTLSEHRFPAVERARAAAGPKERFVAALGGFPERSPLSSWSEPIKHSELSMERVFYRSEPDVVVPGVFVTPPGAAKPYPVVLALPGSSSTDVDVALPWGLPLLRRGMAVFAVDVKASRFGHQMSENAPEAIERGSSALAEMTWDLVRAVDYLETRPDVDASRIGCFGISIGGTQTWLLAAVDERVKAAVPVVGVASYRAIIEGIRDESIDSTYMSCLDSHTIYYYPPGLLQVGDQADFLALIAPRPLLILAMSADNCFPQAGVEETSQALRQVYTAMGAGDRFDYYVSEGPHSYPLPLQERVWDWMQRWL